MRVLQAVHGKVMVLALAASCALMAQGPLGRPGFGFGGGLEVGRFTGKTVTGAPFSATMTEQYVQTLATGNQIQRQEQAEVYRDSQGRVRIDASVIRPTSSGSQTVKETTIYDPVGGYVYRLNPQKMTALQTAIRQRTPQTRTNRPSDPNVTTQNLGTQVVNGVTATGTQVTRMIPAGTIGNAQAIQTVRVTHLSTELQIPVHITFTDPRSGTRTMNLTNIVQSEPDTSLFVVPSGYSITAAPAGRARGALRAAQ
jgi:hypothetical protein